MIIAISNVEPFDEEEILTEQEAQELKAKRSAAQVKLEEAREKTAAAADQPDDYWQTKTH